MWDGKKYWDGANDGKLRGTFNDQGNFEKRLFLRANHTGSCMSVQDTIVTSTVLTTTKFCGFSCERYYVNPP